MARRRRRLRAARAEGLDEAAGLSGWLYTDLLLGLFVVFIGAVAFTALTFGSSTDAVEDEGLPAPSTSSTTTTTTSEPVQLCARLLSPPPSREDDPILIDRNSQDSELRGVLEEQLLRDIEEANAASIFGTLDRKSIRIGMVLASGGGQDIDAGVSSARSMEARLREVFADDPLFRDVVFRNFGTRRVPGGKVKLELFPVVDSPCIG